MNPRELEEIHDWSGIRKLLIFGGTFDPPHLAHVQLPGEAAQAIDADYVVYVPAACSPHKVGRHQSDAVHRVAMLRLALRSCDRCLLWLDEINRAGDGQPSYTVETLRRLRAIVPDHVQLRLLIGADQVAGFHTWRNPEEVARLAEPLVMLRAPLRTATLLQQLSVAMQDQWRDRLVELSSMPISSTAIRAALQSTNDEPAGLDPAVLAYIRSHDLYTPDATEHDP